MIRSVVRAVARERAVLAGIAIAVLQAVAAGQITKATAVPVIVGIVLRFLVTPTVTLAPVDKADHADHADPEAFHAG